MAEITIAYGQKVYMEQRGVNVVIGLRNADNPEPLAEIGLLQGELDLLTHAFEWERNEEMGA